MIRGARVSAERRAANEIARRTPIHIERTCLTGVEARCFVLPIDILFTALPPWAERPKRKRSVGVKTRLFALSDGAVY